MSSEGGSSSSEPSEPSPMRALLSAPTVPWFLEATEFNKEVTSVFARVSWVACSRSDCKLKLHMMKQNPPRIQMKVVMRSAYSMLTWWSASVLLVPRITSEICRVAYTRGLPVNTWVKLVSMLTNTVRRGRIFHNLSFILCCVASEAYTGKISIRLTASVCNWTTMPRVLASIMLCDTS